MTSVEAGDPSTSSWVRRKQKKPLTMNLTLKGSPDDAEQLLQSLGFSADQFKDRIPKRFLHPSKLKGIQFDYQYILDHHLETGPPEVIKLSPSSTITGKTFFQYWCSKRLVQQDPLEILTSDTEIFIN